MGDVCSTFVVSEGFVEYHESTIDFPSRAVRVLKVLPCGPTIRASFSPVFAETLAFSAATTSIAVSCWAVAAQAINAVKADFA
jgi:hypothetical protein